MRGALGASERLAALLTARGQSSVFGDVVFAEPPGASQRCRGAAGPQSPARPRTARCSRCRSAPILRDPRSAALSAAAAATSRPCGVRRGRPGRGRGVGLRGRSLPRVCSPRPTALHSYAPTCVSLHPSVSATLHRFFIPASLRFLHGYIPPFLHPFIAPPLHLCVPTSIPTSLHLSTPTSLIHPSLYIPASFQSYSPTTPHPISPTSLHSHIPASLFPYISLHPSNPTAPHPLYSSTPPLPHTTILTPPAPCIPSQGSRAVNRNDTAGFWCQSRIWRVLVLRKAESRAPSSRAAISPLQNPLQVHPGVSWARGANAAPQPGETEAWSNAKSRAQRHSGLEQAQENKHCASYSHCCLCTLQPSTLRAH